MHPLSERIFLFRIVHDMADLARYCADRLFADNYQSLKGNRLLMRPPRYDLSIKIVSANVGRVRLQTACSPVCRIHWYRAASLRRCSKVGRNEFLWPWTYFSRTALFYHVKIKRAKWFFLKFVINSEFFYYLLSYNLFIFFLNLSWGWISTSIWD